MKRTTTLVLICLSVLYAPHAFGQDSSRITHDLEETTQDDQDTTQAKAHRKKPTSHASVAIEIGLGDNYLVTGGSFNTALLGWRAGAFVYVPIVGKFCIQSGLFYATSGGGSTVGGVTGSGGTVVAGSTNYYGYTANITSTVWHIQSLELPLNFGFLFNRRHSTRTFIGIGPYAAYNIGGNSSYNESSAGSYVHTGSLNIGTSANADLRPFDYGIGLIENTDFKGFLVGVRAQYGLANLSPQPNTTMSSFEFGVQLGYAFGNKGKHKVRAHSNDEYIDRIR